MPKRYLIANWKMNLPPEGLETYMRVVGTAPVADILMVVAPPFPYIAAAHGLRHGHVAVGAQNCADQPSGAFTGEVSPGMLRGLGAIYAVVGHSERRTVYGESDALISRKLALAIATGLTPVLCIGEDLKVREAGHAARFLADQVKAVTSPALESADVIVAYEPIWAIGTGRNASGAMCAETTAEIRDAIGRFWPARHAGGSLLYGGSVTPDNVADLVSNGHIDGFLVGGASLDSARFLAIHRAMTAG